MSYIMEIRPLIGHRVLPLPAAGVCVRDEAGRFLLVLARGPQGEYWQWPGGMVEIGETGAQAAVREYEEETGLQVELTRLIGVYSGPGFAVTYLNGDQVEYTATMFEGRIIGGALRQTDGVEVFAAAYFTLDEIATLPMLGDYRRIAYDAVRASAAVWM